MHTFSDRCEGYILGGLGGGTLGGGLFGTWWGMYYARDGLAEAHGVAVSRLDLVLESALYGVLFGGVISLFCFLLVFPLYVGLTFIRESPLNERLETGLSCGLLVGLALFLFDSSSVFTILALISSGAMGLSFALVDRWFYKHYPTP